MSWARPRPSLALLALLAVATSVLGTGVVSVRAAGTGLYVDKTVPACSDRGPGSISTPFCTIAKAMAYLRPGYTVFIGNGTYAETVAPGTSGAPRAPVIIAGWPGRQPVVGAGMTHGVRISGRSYVKVLNLQVSGTTRDGIAVSGGRHVTVSGNEVSGAGSPHGRTAAGIRVSGTKGATVANNYTHDNSGSGIVLAGRAAGARVEHNESSYNTRGTGIEVSSPGSTLLGNITHGNEQSGIAFSGGGDRGLAALNVAYDNAADGLAGVDVAGGRLVGNTLFRNCAAGIGIGGSSTGFVVENNIAVDNGDYPDALGRACTGRSANIGVWDAAASGTTTADHNLVWLSRPGTMYAFGQPYGSLTGLRAAAHQEAHGVQADPQFADPAARDLSLRGDSPAIDRADSAVAGEQSTDLFGRPRTDDSAVPDTDASGPRRIDDLGAFEYTQTVNPAAELPSAGLHLSPVGGDAPLVVTADAGSSTDPQQDTLTYSFDFGDGTAACLQHAPVAGHVYSVPGSYQVRVTVTNSRHQTSTATAIVTAKATTGPVAPVTVASLANASATNAILGLHTMCGPPEAPPTTQGASGATSAASPPATASQAPPEAADGSPGATPTPEPTPSGAAGS